MNKVSLCAAALLVVVAAGFAMTATVVHSKGSAPNNPMHLPNDNDTAVELTADGNSKFVWMHNDTGKQGDIWGQGKQEGIDAAKLRVSVKNKHSDCKPSKPYRVVVESVTKESPQTGKWDLDVSDGISPAAGGESVLIGLNPPLRFCHTVQIKLKVQRRVGGVWGNDNSKCNVNFELAYGDGRTIEQGKTGDETTDTGEGARRSIGDIFDGIEPPPNFDAVKVEEFATEAQAPDLVFTEGSGWLMPTGTLRFVATSGASFSSESNLQVIARDAMGEDPVSAFDVGFGSPSVVDGEIVVPVNSRNPEPCTAFRSWYAAPLWTCRRWPAVPWSAMPSAACQPVQDPCECRRWRVWAANRLRAR